MTTVRLLGIVIIFYGLSYIQFGIKQMYEAVNYAGQRQVNWYIIITNLNIGLMVFVIGIGVLLAKEWARILWLMSSIALASLHIAFLALFYANGQTQAQQLLNTGLILILLVISWTTLNREKVKQLFS